MKNDKQRRKQRENPWWTNLLEETLEVLKKNGKSEIDVRWVGCRSQYPAHWFTYYFNGIKTWEEFKEEAKDIWYDRGYGNQEIANGLVIVGDNWWMERHEYDGLEWWEFKTLPKKEDYEERRNEE
jgi:hypothetical protein